MKKKAITIILATSILLSLCSCQNKNNIREGDLLAGYSQSINVTNYNFTDNTATAPELYTKFTASLTNNAINLLKSTNNDNSVFSILSLIYMLGSVSNGASGSSLKILKSYLGDGMALTELNNCFKYIYTRITTFNTDNNYINLDNAIFVSKEKEIKKSYLQKLLDNYNTDAFETDYNNDSSNKLNEWFNNLCQKNNIVTDIKNNDEIYLLSNISAKLAWINPYSEKQTKTADFNGYNSKNKVKYLCSVERYFENSKAKGFIKSFANSTCKFVVIVPNSDLTLSEYINQINGEEFSNLINSNKSLQFANVEMPTFSIDTSVKYKNILSEYGLKDEFTSSADFTNICSKNLYINDIYQNISLEISESGLMPYSQPANEVNNPPYSTDVENTLIIDRPFIYAIVDNEYNTPIIIGTISNI